MGLPDTLGALVERHAATAPASTALIFEQRETSYAQLADEGGRLARRLVALGNPVGARIAYLGRNHDRMIVTMIACAMAGCVFTPINWRLSDDELRFVLEDSDAALLFHSREHGAFAQGQGRPAVDLDDDDAWHTLVTDAASTLPTVTADDAVLQIYSSGTTGRPKGVVLTHAAVLAGGETVLSGEIGGMWGARDRTLIALPLFHVSALLMATYTLVAGAGAVIVRDAALDAITQAARAHRATRVGLVPTVIQMLLDTPGVDLDAFETLELIVYGGSTITPALLDRAKQAFGCSFLQLFGMSETFTIGTILRPADHLSGNPAILASCGQPLPGVGIRVVDADGADVPTGEPGEILIRYHSLMTGYWKLPEATAEVLQDGWYRTGDVGSLDARGYLTIRDRLKDMVISGGENVYPAEVEAALATHPAVAEVAVIGRPHPRWGEAVTAVVVPRPGALVAEDEMIAHARARIAHYKCPSKVIVAPDLPKNAGGKVLKRILRERYS